MAVVHGVRALAVWLSLAGMLAYFDARVRGVDLAPLLPVGSKPLTWDGSFYGLGGATAFVSGTLLAFFCKLLAGGARDGRT